MSTPWNQERSSAPSEYQSDHEIERYLDEMKARDPGFERGSFLRDAQGVFEDVTKAWLARNSNISRPWMMDHLWINHDEGIRALLNEGRKPMMDGFALMDVRITGAWAEDGYDCVLLRFTATSTDYELDDKSGKPRDKRHKPEAKVWHEEWTFGKPFGELTPGSVAPGSPCPQCGAPGDGGTRCQYCGQLRGTGRTFRDVWKAASIETMD